MDVKQAIHIGTECIVIGGIVFYFRKEIVALKQENLQLRQELQNIHHILSGQANLLKNIMGRNGTEDFFERPHRPRPPPHPNTEAPRNRQNTKKKVRFEEPEETASYDADELDKELVDIYQSLDMPTDEDVCEGEVCTLKQSIDTENGRKKKDRQ